MLKKLFAVLLVICMVFSISACSNKTTTLDFYNYDNSDLFRLINQKVEIYGYLLLNPSQNNVAYVAELPYRAISNDQVSGNVSYAEIDMKTNGVVAVHFKETPKYTSMPIKITGTLEAGPFTDAYYFKYDYRIKNATYEVVDFSYLDATLQGYYNLAKQGYMDVVYGGVLDIEIFITDTNATKFPELKDYENVVKELNAKTRTTMEEEYLTMLNKLNTIYTTHKELYDKGELNREELVNDVETFYNEFDVFLTAYAGIAPTGAVPTE